MYALSYPAATGEVITQGHADYCAANGCATLTEYGIVASFCPRCGESNSTETYTVRAIKYAVLHTFPNGERIGNGYLTVPGRPLLVLTGDYDTTELTATRCRANNPGHTFVTVEYI